MGSNGTAAGACRLLGHPPPFSQDDAAAALFIDVPAAVTRAWDPATQRLVQIPADVPDDPDDSGSGAEVNQLLRSIDCLGESQDTARPNRAALRHGTVTVGSPPGSFGSGFDTTVEYDFLWKPTSAPWVVDLLPDPAAAGVTFAVLAVTGTRFEIRTTGLGEGGRAVISWSVSRGRVTGYALQSSTAAVQPASPGAAAVLVGGFAGSALRSTAALLLGVQPATSVALSRAATDDPIQLVFSGGGASGDTVEVPLASVAADADLADFAAWAEVPSRIVHDFGYSPEALQARVPVRPSAGLEAAIGAAGLTLLVTAYLPLFIPSSVWGCATPPAGGGVTRCYGMSAGVCVDRATDTPDLPIAAEYFAVEARANGLFDVVAYTDADCSVPRPQQLGLDVGNPEFAAVAGAVVFQAGCSASTAQQCTRIDERLAVNPATLETVPMDLQFNRVSAALPAVVLADEGPPEIVPDPAARYGGEILVATRINSAVFNIANDGGVALILSPALRVPTLHHVHIRVALFDDVGAVGSVAADPDVLLFSPSTPSTAVPGLSTTTASVPSTTAPPTRETTTPQPVELGPECQDSRECTSTGPGETMFCGLSYRPIGAGTAFFCMPCWACGTMNFNRQRLPSTEECEDWCPAATVTTHHQTTTVSSTTTTTASSATTTTTTGTAVRQVEAQEYLVNIPAGLNATFRWVTRAAIVVSPASIRVATQTPGAAVDAIIFSPIYAVPTLQELDQIALVEPAVTVSTRSVSTAISLMGGDECTCEGGDCSAADGSAQFICSAVAITTGCTCSVVATGSFPFEETCTSTDTPASCMPAVEVGIQRLQPGWQALAGTYTKHLRFVANSTDGCTQKISFERNDGGYSLLQLSAADGFEAAAPRPDGSSADSDWYFVPAALVDSALSGEHSTVFSVATARVTIAPDSASGPIQLLSRDQGSGATGGFVGPLLWTTLGGFSNVQPHCPRAAVVSHAFGAYSTASVNITVEIEPTSCTGANVVTLDLVALSSGLSQLPASQLAVAVGTCSDMTAGITCRYPVQPSADPQTLVFTVPLMVPGETYRALSYLSNDAHPCFQTTAPSLDDNTAEFRVPLSVPLHPRVTVVVSSPSEVVATWAGMVPRTMLLAEVFTGYTVRVQLASGNGPIISQQVAGGIDTCSVLDTLGVRENFEPLTVRIRALAAGQIYNISVSANGRLPAASAMAFQTASELYLLAPAELWYTQNYTGPRVRFEWTPVVAAVGYQLDICVASADNSCLRTVVSTTHIDVRNGVNITHVEVNLNSKLSYYATVRGYSTGALGCDANQRCIRVGAVGQKLYGPVSRRVLIPPRLTVHAPVSVSAASLEPSSVDIAAGASPGGRIAVTWTNSEAVAGTRYRVRALPTEVAADRECHNSSALSSGSLVYAASSPATVDGLVGGLLYRVWVSTVSASGLESYPSNPVTVMTSGGQPSAPKITSIRRDAQSYAVAWMPPCAANAVVVSFRVAIYPVGAPLPSTGTCDAPSCLTESITSLETSLDLPVPGHWMISVAAVSATGVVGDADVLYAHVPSALAIDRSSDSADEDSGFGTTGLIAMAIVIIVIFIGSIFFMALRSNQQASLNSDLEFELNQMKLGIEELTDQVKKLFSEEFAKTIGDATDIEEKFHRLEIDRHQLELGEEIGKGAFGVVCRATMVGPLQNSPDGHVAVKMLLEGAASDELTKFLVEARLMALLDHPSLVKLLAVVTIDQPFMIVTELMAKGDLKGFLRSCRPDAADGGPKETLSSDDLFKMIYDISCALMFLEQRHVIHRDIAARNVLCAANNEVKLSDFGLSRNIVETDYYRKKSDDRVPVKWMAPESINDRIYTNLSDVWSFGVLIWEITSLAQSPYAEYSAVEAIAAVTAGYRMKKPELCGQRLYDELVMQCWQYKAEQRPTFAHCNEILLEMGGKAVAGTASATAVEQSTRTLDVDGYVDDAPQVERTRSYVDADGVDAEAAGPCNDVVVKKTLEDPYNNPTVLFGGKTIPAEAMLGQRRTDPAAAQNATSAASAAAAYAAMFDGPGEGDASAMTPAQGPVLRASVAPPMPMPGAPRYKQLPQMQPPATSGPPRGTLPPPHLARGTGQFQMPAPRFNNVPSVWSNPAALQAAMAAAGPRRGMPRPGVRPPWRGPGPPPWVRPMGPRQMGGGPRGGMVGGRGIRPMGPRPGMGPRHGYQDLPHLRPGPGEMGPRNGYQDLPHLRPAGGAANPNGWNQYAAPQTRQHQDLSHLAPAPRAGRRSNNPDSTAVAQVSSGDGYLDVGMAVHE